MKPQTDICWDGGTQKTNWESKHIITEWIHKWLLGKNKCAYLKTKIWHKKRHRK